MCLTPDNLERPWINFEAGALAGSIESKLVCPYLVSLEKKAIGPPLALLNLTQADRTETFMMVKSMNERLVAESAARDTTQLAKLFDTFWPELEGHIKNAKGLVSKDSVPTRKTDDILEELLSLARGHTAAIAELKGSMEPTNSTALAEAIHLARSAGRAAQKGKLGLSSQEAQARDWMEHQNAMRTLEEARKVAAEQAKGSPKVSVPPPVEPPHN